MRNRVGVGLARVDLERQPGLARGGDVAAEAFGLRLGRRVLVVVVEARLADGDDLRVLREAHDLVGRMSQLLVRVVGMRADRAIDVVDSARRRRSTWSNLRMRVEIVTMVPTPADARARRSRRRDRRRSSGKSRWQWWSTSIGTPFQTDSMRDPL